MTEMAPSPVVAVTIGGLSDGDSTGLCRAPSGCARRARLMAPQSREREYPGSCWEAHS